MTETATVAEIVNAAGDIAPDDYPIPVGWRVLIEPIKVEEKTQSGLVLPEQAREAKEHLRSIGRVVAMGPLCYQHAKFGPKPDPWCQVGDYVAYGAYSGAELKVRSRNDDGWVSLKLINDDEVLSVIPTPESVLIYC